MLIFDELKKSDPQLRLVAMMFAGGLGILIAGLWWVQIVSARKFQSHLETQAYRSVRLPAVRGKIFDREGRVLAENQPRYNLSLYLDDLRKQCQKEYNRLRPVKIVTNSPPFWKFWSGSKSITTQRVRLKQSQINALALQARYNVANNLVAQISRQLGQPIALNAADFNRNYNDNPYVPYPILKNVSIANIARFEEQSTNSLYAGLELESARFYPYRTVAAHLLGYVRRDDRSIEGEEPYFSYRLPDYRGLVGVEGGFDPQLHGWAGAASVLINSQGYRQSENVWNQPEPGRNVVLTIDLDIQQAAERSLVRWQSADARGAIVVMDVRSGDVLAMVSSPTFDPNDFAQGISQDKWDQVQKLTAEKNRATFENYAPGSIFKTVVALAALENGLNPEEIYHVEPNPRNPRHGAYFFNPKSFKDDTAPPGDYNFKKAFIHSSNSYFMNAGLTHAGIENIIRIGKEFHLGERTGLFARQETKGNLPTLERVNSSEWRAGDTANVCIGQGEVNVTPIQMAVMTAAIANGGKVLWPRLVERIEPQDPAAGEIATNFPSGVVRDELSVKPRSLQILREAMLADVQDADGTGTPAAVKGLQICGKTGTAQVQDEHNNTIGWNYWFASFAPYENPKYAVVVMVESQERGSGTTMCAPIARGIYEEILKKENTLNAKVLAQN